MINNPNLRKVSLTVITKDNSILLGMKKIGFGKGHFNGFGGKPEAKETLLDCVCRETKEEAGIELLRDKLELVAIIDFYFTNKPKNWDQQVHIFKTNSFNGEPIETEEMRPEWFPLNNIPYKEMWPDDIFWLPKVLEDKKLRGSFTFAEDGSILKKEILEVNKL